MAIIAPESCSLARYVISYIIGISVVRRDSGTVKCQRGYERTLHRQEFLSAVVLIIMPLWQCSKTTLWGNQSLRSMFAHSMRVD